MSAKPLKFVTLGRISGVFGVRGWLKIQSYTQPAGNIARYRVWTLRSNGAERVVELVDAREHGAGVVAKLAGVDDPEGARGYIGAEIFVGRQSLPATGPNEYYWADLVGLEVRAPNGAVLGVVDHLLATGTHDVLVLRGETERLVPFVVGSVIQRVDLDAGVIVADWSPEY